jgi:pimeloyl-ACP methyl ester carboxylesterase
MATSGTVQRPGGVEIAYEDTGDGAGGDRPAIVLTHGFTLTLRMWDPTVDALTAAGWRVVTWDARGHGQTSTPDDPACYTLDAVVDDLTALLDHLGLRRPVIGGLSFGGYLALAYWCARPDRVRALVLADCGPGYRNPQAREQWNRTAMERATDIESRGAEALAGDPSAGSSPEVRARAGLERHRSLPSLVHAVRGFLTQHDGRVMERIEQVDVPALVVVGEQDDPFRKASEVMAAKIPDARLVVIPGAGHVANLDQPEAFNRAMLDFLAGLG